MDPVRSLFQNPWLPSRLLKIGHGDVIAHCRLSMVKIHSPTNMLLTLNLLDSNNDKPRVYDFGFKMSLARSLEHQVAFQSKQPNSS